MTSSTRKKLLLINPANKTRKGFRNDPSTCFMPVGLGIVAALTPDHWQVELLDESFEDFSFRPADLVGFTSFTATATRAYQIAATYRAAGIHTVMGGFHASMCPDEVAEYIDTVVTGEAENIWSDLIRDFETGNIKKLYSGGITDVNNIPHLRRDIYKYPYAYDLVQTSRGCPIGCDFCTVTQMCGKTYRERDVEDVLDELEQTTRPLLFFVDDNLVNNNKDAQERAIRLFKGMVQRGIKKFWLSQAALNFADNEEVLYWARKSGCRIILMGIEAESVQALKDVKKNLNLSRGVDSYERTFKKIHKYGISILATMIFGMESDTVEDLVARRNFILRSSIDTYQCTILTPLPGTGLYNRVKNQDRIVLNNLPEDWNEYDGMTSTFNTPQLDHITIKTTMRDIWLSLYNKETIRKKLFRTLWNTRSFMAAYWAYSSGHNYGRMFLEENIKNDPAGVNERLEWKNKKRSIYLKVTDKVIFLIYLFFWGKRVRQMNG